jgi:hypothetical protein
MGNVQEHNLKDIMSEEEYKNYMEAPKAKAKVKLTPKRAALILLNDWISNGGTSPWYKDTDEINDQLEDWGYNVTELRRTQIMEQVDKIIEPFRNRLEDSINKFNV